VIFHGVGQGVKLPQVELYRGFQACLLLGFTMVYHYIDK